MKKLLLILMLVFGITANSQSFAKKYTKVVELKGVNENIIHPINDPRPIDVTVIFSGDSAGDIVICYGLNTLNKENQVKIERFYKISGILNLDSKSRYIHVINEKGTKIIIQLYDIGNLMIHYPGYSLEFIQ